MRDNSIVQDIKDIERDLAEFKAVQLSGAGNTKVYEYETSDEWDVDETATPSSLAGTLSCLFTTNNQPGAFVAFEVTCLIDDTPFYSYVGSDGQIYASSLTVVQDTSDVDVAKRQSRVSFGWSCDNGANIKIKVRAVSLSKGVLTVTAS